MIADADVVVSRQTVSPRRRAAVLLATIALMALTLAVNVSAAFGQKAPALALGLWPYDARAKLRSGAAHVVKEVAAPETIALVRQSIARDPGLPLAYVLLAMDPRASKVQSDLALGYSRILSRRDQGTTFLLLQNSLKRGQLEGFLTHFDIAMRTSNKAAESFAPVVIKAMSDERIVDGLAKLLARRPVWGRDFLLSAINGAPTAMKAARLVDAVLQGGVPVEPDYVAVLINRLLSEANFTQAWALYGKSFSARASAPLRPLVRFAPTTTGFDWVLTNESDLWAQVEGSSAAPTLRYFANAGASGTVARQFVMLQPGRYAMTYRASAQGGAAFESKWVAACRGTVILGQIDAQRDGNLTFSVPVGCPVVELRLTANADLNVVENEGTIEAIRLARVSP